MKGLVTRMLVTCGWMNETTKCIGCIDRVVWNHQKNYINALAVNLGPRRIVQSVIGDVSKRMLGQKTEQFLISRVD